MAHDDHATGDGGLSAHVPRGAAFHAVQMAGPTRDYAFVVVPGFTLLAFASAVEPLRIANQLSQQPLYRWRVLSVDGAPVASSSGIPVGVDAALSAPDRDTRLFVCAGNPAMAAADPAVVAQVARHHRFGGEVGGICTGAVALARAGLLSGKRFTLHWENQPGFAEVFRDLAPTPNRFEHDGRVMSCGGGAASTDMMLSFIAADYGSAFAAVVSDMCLRTVLTGVAPAQRSSVASILDTRNPVLIALVNLMQRNIETPLSTHALAAAAGYSRRHVERLFHAATGQSPGTFYRGLRLDHARSLLGTTEMTLVEIATACGFASVTHFARCFRERFGAAPSRLRRA